MRIMNLTLLFITGCMCNMTEPVTITADTATPTSYVAETGTVEKHEPLITFRMMFEGVEVPTEWHANDVLLGQTGVEQVFAPDTLYTFKTGSMSNLTSDGIPLHRLEDGRFITCRPKDYLFSPGEVGEIFCHANVVVEGDFDCERRIFGGPWDGDPWRDPFVAMSVSRAEILTIYSYQYAFLMEDLTYVIAGPNINRILHNGVVSSNYELLGSAITATQLEVSFTIPDNGGADVYLTCSAVEQK